MVARAGLMFDDFSHCESPIEALMQLAMAANSRRGVLEWCNADTVDEHATKPSGLISTQALRDAA